MPEWKIYKVTFLSYFTVQMVVTMIDTMYPLIQVGTPARRSFVTPKSGLVRRTNSCLWYSKRACAFWGLILSASGSAWRLSTGFSWDR